MPEETREPEMGLAFENVWAMFQETDQRMRETDRLILCLTLLKPQRSKQGFMLSHRPATL
jgi:hypothetical protein